MKIFYGCNGVGNGHVTRTRLMARALYDIGITDIDFLFSGRPSDDYFDMDIFRDYTVRTGIKFNVTDGKVNPTKTLLNIGLKEFQEDIRDFDLSKYDLVISDYEPITSWAAKIQGKKCLGIGHQYAFNYDIPVGGDNFITRQVMKNFAPVSHGIGLHWQSCQQPILPPIIDVETLSLKYKVHAETKNNHILVYLPFENQKEVAKILSRFTKHEFIIYAPIHSIPYCSSDNIWFKAPSKNGFLQDLIDCSGVICNAGFELISEALYIGKKILAKPLAGQMEQISNAKALKQFNYGRTMDTLNTIDVGEFLADKGSVMVSFPNVAKILAQTIKYSNVYNLHEGSFKDIWQKVKTHRTY